MGALTNHVFSAYFIYDEQWQGGNEILWLTLKSKYIIAKRELKEMELDAQYWKRQHDIEFAHRKARKLNNIIESIKEFE